MLSGIRVLEFAAQGPGPFCGMLLADLGADVILVERPGPADGPDFRDTAISHRGKRSITLDLKQLGDVETALRLAAESDVLIEGFRPGVMERLGLGPEACAARNTRLVYGRMTGWGQDGPDVQRAGHDVNYIAVSGALWYSSPAGALPWAPPTLLGDLGGGALYLALGLLAGLLHVRAGGTGQVVDAAIVDGSASLMNLLLAVRAAGKMPDARGAGVLDGAPFYATYRCADGRAISVGALEPKFYRALIQGLGLEGELDVADQYESARWPEARAAIGRRFAAQSCDEWCRALHPDSCVAPVLSPGEAARHPHLQARNVFVEADGVHQAAPAPRFSGFPAMPIGRIPKRGEHTAEILGALAARMPAPSPGLGAAPRD